MNKDYQVTVRDEHGQKYLSISHNGYQRTSLSIKDVGYEIPLIIKELERHLSASQQPDPPDLVDSIRKEQIAAGEQAVISRLKKLGL